MFNQNYIDQFSAAIQASGITAPEHIEADGHIHRFSTKDNPQDKSGWYMLNSDNMPFGMWGDWRRGVSFSHRFATNDKPQRSIEEAIKAHGNPQATHTSSIEYLRELVKQSFLSKLGKHAKKFRNLLVSLGKKGELSYEDVTELLKTLGLEGY